MKKVLAQTLNSNAEPDEEVLAIMQMLVSHDDNTPEEKAYFAENIPVKRISKGEFLLRDHQVLKASYHLFKGGVREYYYKDGEEKTSAFYIAGESLSGDANKPIQPPNGLNWECVSECIVSVFTFEVEKEMYRRFPRLESLCRMGTEAQYSQYKAEMNIFLSSTPLERYEHLLKTKPEVFQTVPLYQIASYLGVKPESLSRIRNRLRSAPRPLLRVVS
ncbi:MAG: Crp/Fnr family transcriptional regulator [Bacteroidota bacterium]